MTSPATKVYPPLKPTVLGQVARDSDVTGANITDIDCIFGWNEQERERSMQQHYAGLDLASRIERLARVTMMV